MPAPGRWRWPPGRISLDELEQARPDAALEDLRDTEALLAALEG